MRSRSWQRRATAQRRHHQTTSPPRKQDRAGCQQTTRSLIVMHARLHTTPRQRLLLLMATPLLAAAALLNPSVASAAGMVPGLPGLPELPQLDDPTVIALSAVHGNNTGSESCYFNPSAGNCNGTDPQTVDCTFDAYTVGGVQTPIIANGASIGYLELRYSPHCGTNWARTTITNSAYVSPLYVRDTYVLGAAGRGDDHFNDQSVRFSAQGYAPATSEGAYVTITMGASTG